MTTTLIRRLALTSALATVLLLGSTTANARPRLRLRARARAVSRSLKTNFNKARTWAHSERGKHFIKSAALVGGGMIVGAALANPAGAALVAGKAIGLGIAAGKIGIGATAAVLSAKVSVGSALAAGVAAHKGAQYGKRAALNHTSIGHEFKKDAKNGFGLFNLFKRGNRGNHGNHAAPAQSHELLQIQPMQHH